MPTIAPPSSIPVLLLKTRSQPHDAYEEYFTNLGANTSGGDVHSSAAISFIPDFVPVLEHRPNTENLGHLETLLKSGGFAEHYGGMIFTSQRAVEAWADVVRNVEQAGGNGELQLQRATGSGMVCPPTSIPSSLNDRILRG
jgi:uroporphyrinogen-III synthase